MPDKKISQLNSGEPRQTGDVHVIVRGGLNYKIPEATQVFNVREFGAVADGITDDYAAIMSAHAAAIIAGGQVYFPRGIYAHVTPFNLSTADTFWCGEGGVRLLYTGSTTTDQFVFDGSSTSNGKRAFLRDLIFDANGLATNGIRLRLAVGGEFSNLRVTNCSGAGFVLEAVTTSLFTSPTVSGNVEVFSVTPTTGILFRAIPDGPLAGHAGGNVTLVNPKIEHVSGVGIDIGGCQGTNVVGGTSEANGTGLRLTTGGLLTTLEAVDMEANTARDLDIATAYNSFINCIFASHGGGVTEAVKLRSGTVANRFHDGYLYNVVLDSGANYNQFNGVSFTGNATQIADSGTSNATLECYNAFTGARLASQWRGALNVDADIMAGKAIGVQAQLDAAAVYTASGIYTLTNAYADLPGVTTGAFTPTANETAYVWITVPWLLTGGTASTKVNDVLLAALDLNFSSTQHLQSVIGQTNVPGITAGTDMAAGILEVSQFYSLQLTAGVTYTIKVVVQNQTAARGRVNSSAQMFVWRVAR